MNIKWIEKGKKINKKNEVHQVRNNKTMPFYNLENWFWNWNLYGTEKRFDLPDCFLELVSIKMTLIISMWQSVLLEVP